MATNGEARPQSRVASVAGFTQRQLDRVVSPPTRRRLYDFIADFASEKPLLFVLFSFLPVLLFTGFAISTAFFALVSAVLFSLFWVGVAMLVLVPTLFVTFSIGVLVWIWGVSSFLIARWVYNILPVSARGDLSVGMPNGKQVIFEKREKDGGLAGVETKIKQEA